ncbi:MAG: N-acetyltransferase [Clostridia bacterium]|nr:N-acetyltransferase [Clostridia bacterium]
MISVKRVETKKEMKEFVNFPLRLYKNCPYFVPPLYADEMNMFKPNYTYGDTCSWVCFLATEDGKTVGRIQGILHRASNEKSNEKRVRFTHFDSIDDEKTAAALFRAVEDWAKENGMDTVCGPLSFSDLEREGLLIEGFDQMSTFEEQYNYDYYGKLVEKCGYAKEVDWLEYKIYPLDKVPEQIVRIKDMVFRKYNLHLGTAKNKIAFLEKYKDGIFNVLDESYNHLYGTVPFTENMKKQIVDQFMLFIDMKYIQVICDENDKVVSFGLSFPSLSRALNGTKGKLSPVTLFRLLRALKKVKVVDLGLIGILPQYHNRGINAISLFYMMDMMIKMNLDYLETNLCLENNYQIQAQWNNNFEIENHKRRRSYIKSI